MRKSSERGQIATADMRARVRAGWSVEDLWDRMAAAEAGAGYSYDMAESLPSTSNTPVTEDLLVVK